MATAVKTGSRPNIKRQIIVNFYELFILHLYICVGKSFASFLFSDFDITAIMAISAPIRFAVYFPALNSLPFS